MDKLKDLEELGLGSRLKRLSEGLMKEIQLVYDKANIDFDSYLFPVFKTIVDEKITTTSIITEKLKITQPAVTQSISKLFDRGLINYKGDDNDKRKKIIKLSPKGYEDIKKLTPLWNIIDKTIKHITTKPSNSFLDQIDELESLIHKNTLSKKILNNYEKKLNEAVQVIPFQKKYAPYFKKLNIQWLEKYFVVEPHDSKLLENCQENIIDKGGHIFFATINNKIIGCYSFIKISNKKYELGKMAIDPEYQDRKIGQKLLRHSIQFAKDNKWDLIILYSNTKLENAIYIYKKFGFIEVPLENKLPYLRCNIKMELNPIYV